MIIFYSNDCNKCKVLENKLLEQDIGYIKESSMKTILEKSEEYGITEMPFCEVKDEIKNFSEMMELLENNEL